MYLFGTHILLFETHNEMGVDSSLRNDYGKLRWAAPAFKEGNPRMPTGSVTIHDILIHFIQSFQGFQLGGHEVTGRKLYEICMRTVRIDILRPEVAVAVIIVDDPLNVPKEKNKTQVKRMTAASKQSATSNSIDSMFYEDWQEMEFDLDKGFVNKIDGHSHLINLKRLKSTKQLRRKMCHFLREQLELEMLPENKTIIFDYDAKGPYIFQGDRCYQDTDLYHKLGEADLAILYWCRVFRARPVKVLTTDTDFMPLMVNYLMDTPASDLNSRVIWIYEKKAYVDMREFTDLVLDKSNLTPRAFALMCIASGSDVFIRSDQPFHGIGLDSIVHAVQRCEPRLTRSKFESDPGLLCPEEVDRFIRAVFTHKLSKSERSVVLTKKRKLEMVELGIKDPETFMDKQKRKIWPTTLIASRLSEHKKIKPPTEEGVAFAHEMLQFNLDYWTEWGWKEWASNASKREREPSAYTQAKTKMNEAE